MKAKLAVLVPGVGIFALYRRKDPNFQILEYECQAMAPPSTN